MAKLFLPKSIRENEGIKEIFSEKPSLNSEKVVTCSIVYHKKLGEYESSHKIPKPCVRCGKIFEPYNRRVVHCNMCIAILRNNLKLCPWCGKWHKLYNCCQCNRRAPSNLFRGLCRYCRRKTKIEGVLIFGQ